MHLGILFVALGSHGAIQLVTFRDFAPKESDTRELQDGMKMA
jgi:hypothetical protein